MTDTKTCAACGREITWRKKWADDWDQIRYCSQACRRHKVSDQDRRLETLILDRLAHTHGTICPSEVARDAAEDWRPLMEPVRRAARRLVAAGQVEIVQNGRPVDPSRARGPIRIRRV